ncbi:unnamed protein product [Caenorhabditis auriculariae]|uniref:4-hydroxybenzoate polyprenyltransferase, mitochondrial n=1 Tax=Caenorhabditis auriculariae TaxID=2777116 RepID=A0A8S1GXR4_9PELO|nr:unnamed protein product [Caenorhabditis auriculariae]
MNLGILFHSSKLLRRVDKTCFQTTSCVYSSLTEKWQKQKLPTAASIVASAPSSVKPYLQIMRADKPIGTWLLFWPSAWAIAMATPAGQLPSFYYLSLFGAGAFLMRSAGCVINDLWDKDFDKKVERTKMRPLACGSLTNKQAVGLLSVLLSSSLAILLQFNWYSVAVGASSMLLVVGYPLAKRFTYWPQFVLGATLNWGILIVWAELASISNYPTFFALYLASVLHTAVYDTIYSHQTCCAASGLTFNWGALLGWTAIRGDLTATPLLLYVAALQWTLVYDTIYAHQDKTDDVLIGVKSTALRFGEDTKKWLTGFSTSSVGLLALSGMASHQQWPYYAAVFGVASHLGWQIVSLDIHNGEDCWRKFRANRWIGFLLFSGIIASTLLKEKNRDDFDESDLNHD